MTRPEHMRAKSAIISKEALFIDKITKDFTAVIKRNKTQG